MSSSLSLQVGSFVKPTIDVYDLRCRAIPLGTAPVGCIICEVGPGQESRVHKHFESEVFLFLSGKGAFVSDGEVMPVDPGTTTKPPAFAALFVRNSTPTEPMQFMSIYWRDEAATTPKPAKPSRETL